MANKKNSKKKGRRILPYEKYRIKNLGNKKVTEDRIQMPPLSNIPPADFSLPSIMPPVEKIIIYLIVIAKRTENFQK